MACVHDAKEFTAKLNSQSKRLSRSCGTAKSVRAVGPASQRTPVPLHRWCGAAAAGAVGAPPSPKIRPDTRCLTLPRTNSSRSIQCALGSPGPRVGTRAQRCSRPPVMYSRPPDCASQRTGAPILLPPQTRLAPPLVPCRLSSAARGYEVAAVRMATSVSSLTVSTSFAPGRHCSPRATLTASAAHSLTLRPAGPTLFIQDQGLPVVLTRRPMPLRCPVPLCARRRHGGAAARHVATHGRESVDAVAATAVTVAATLAVLAQYLPADLEQYLPTHAAAWALHAVAIAYRPARLVIAFGRTAPLSAAAATGAVVATPADQAHAATRRLANLQQLRVFAVLILSLSLAAAHASGGITAIAVDAPNATAHAAPGASVARARRWVARVVRPPGTAAPVCIGKGAQPGARGR